MNSLDKFTEDFQDYLDFCGRLDIVPLKPDRKWNQGQVSFYEHIEEILKLHDVDTEEELFRKLG